VASLIVSPMLVGPANKLAHRLAKLPFAWWIRTSALREPEAGAEGEGGDAKVVIAGFGPVGRAVADRLEVAGVSIAIIELNAHTIERQSRIGKRRMVFGDVTNAEVLESAGVSHAAAVILTVPDEETSLRACRQVRQLNPTAFIAVRTAFLSGMFQATQLGADHVVVEELATADVMQREVIAQLRKREIIPA
jgi:CPA2 family monovalent cation:H+ antiporter-2